MSSFTASTSSFAGRTQRLLRAQAPRAAARAATVVVAKERTMWLPGTSAPKHLDGTIPGDAGAPWALGRPGSRWGFAHIFFSFS